MIRRPAPAGIRRRPVHRIGYPPPTVLPLARLVLIAREHGASLDDLRGRARQPHHARAREQAYRLLFDLGWSQAQIAAEFRRDSSTVHYATNPRKAA